MMSLFHFSPTGHLGRTVMLGIVLILLGGLPWTAIYADEPSILEQYEEYVEPVSVDWGLPPSSVVEFFSYNCNICETVRNYVDHFLLHKPESMLFVYYHVSAAENVAWQMSQVAFAAATLAGIEGNIHDELFDRNALQGNLFLKPEDVRQYLAGVEGGQAAADLVGSEEVAALRAAISQKIKEAGVRQVPTFIVNQRYRVTWGSEMTVQEFTALLLAVAALPPKDSSP